MANFKRKKRKTFRYGTCHGGLKCQYDVARDYCHNTKERRTYRDYKQPQMYNEYGRVV